MALGPLMNSRILVTGPDGFLGQALVNHLQDDKRLLGAKIFAIKHGRETDYESPLWAENVFCQTKPDYVFHLAGFNGGIEFNRQYPADIFYRNTMIGLNVLYNCNLFKVKKVLSVVASCAYPEWECEAYSSWHRKEVMAEGDFLEGPPHGSVACHGYAKRNLQLASKFYNEQYGLRAVTACPTTLYGPGDSFDPLRTKVMGGMIKRFVDAAYNKADSVECWGTGKAMREFLYVQDAARLLVETMLKYEDSTSPLNLGTGQEISVKELAETVAAAAGYRGNIRWDTSKSDGQLRKRLYLGKMNSVLGQQEFVPLAEGIEKTVRWFRNWHRDK